MPFQLPSSVIRGDWLPQLQRVTYRFDPVRGWVTRYEWKGANQQLAINLSNNLALNGIANELTLEHDMAVVEATDATQEYAIDSWEIVANEEVRDLFSHPTLQNAIGTVVGFGTAPGNQSVEFTQVLSAMRQGIQDNSDLFSLASVPIIVNNFVVSVDFDTDTVVWTSEGSILAEFYSLYQNGTTGYQNPQYVLKHKFNISNRWTVFVSDWGVENIYTTAQLLTEVASSGLWIFPLPPSVQYTLAQIPIPAMGMLPVSTTGYQWGWLKTGSTRQTEALNRVNVENNYSLDLWNVDVYPLYGGVSDGGGSAG